MCVFVCPIRDSITAKLPPNTTKSLSLHMYILLACHSECSARSTHHFALPIEANGWIDFVWLSVSAYNQVEIPHFGSIPLNRSLLLFIFLFIFFEKSSLFVFFVHHPHALSHTFAFETCYHHAPSLSPAT